MALATMAAGLLPILPHTATRRLRATRLVMAVMVMRRVTPPPPRRVIYNSGEGKQLEALIVSFDKRSHHGMELRNEKNELALRCPGAAWVRPGQYFMGAWRSRPSPPRRAPSSRRPSSPWPSPRRGMGRVWSGAGDGSIGLRYRFDGKSTILSTFIWLSACRVWRQLRVSAKLRLRTGRPRRFAAVCTPSLYSAGDRAGAAARTECQLLALLPAAGRLLSIR